MTKMNYKTKQREIILDYVIKNKDTHFTAEDLLFYLKQNGTSIGKSTVYRHLDKLVSEDIVRKYYLGEGMPACFQYVDTGQTCKEHFHLKCIKCGTLIHVVCDELEGMANHIARHHHFQINQKKTVLYGICETCANQTTKGETK